MNNYLDNLNENQKDAVKSVDGPVRIIAGPGSGKTKTIVSKITYILDNELAKPEEIVVFTFTNKAANEIKERIHSFTEKEIKNVYTYHGWAARFLRVEATKLGIDKNYIILDTYDRSKLIKNILKENADESIDLKETLSRFSVYSMDEKTKEIEKTKPYYSKISNLYDKYVEKKKEMNSFDFDDLLTEVAKSLNENSELRSYYQNKYKYIFVDEFQDTNPIQYGILKNITTNSSNITVVGDPDQNIYSWRGADIKIILDFKNDFKSTKTFVLNENYRSTKNIINVSNKLINSNENRFNFDVKPIHSEGEPVKVIVGRNKFDEAYQVVREIISLNREHGIKFHDIAIIYRANFISRTFEAELIKHNINYQLIGGFKFFERKEVKETLQFFFFLYKKDDFTLRDIINIPARGIGEMTLNNLLTNAFAETKTLWEYLKENTNDLPKKLKDFVETTNKYINKIENEDPILTLKDYLKDIGFIDYYFPNEDKYENIMGLFDQLKIMIEKSESINELFNWMTLQSSGDLSSKQNNVTLITAHASKGLEFNSVFLVAFNEGTLPSRRSTTKIEIEEEKRIAYVAMTRAEQRLYLTYSTDYDYATQDEMKPSNFFKYIQNDLNNYNYNTGELKDIPGGFVSSKNVKLILGDEIMHKTYGLGKVINVEDSFFTANFEKGIGDKELMVGHPSYSIKK